MSAKAIWYFDFISPFAYLQWQKLKVIRGCSFEYRPLLFAALLDHHGNKGPAEVPSKRLFSYRHVQWRADQAGIDLRFPPAHPFNPLYALRLCVAAGTTELAIDTREYLISEVDQILGILMHIVGHNPITPKN